jgi:carbonic anhydrase/acetyltransferase-like protein (isoleucine patch superfamily)
MSVMPSFSRWRRLTAARLVHAAWRRLQQAGTVTAETAAGRRFAAFGPNSLIAFPTGTIYGERWIEVGNRTMIGEQASICAGIMPGHDLGPDPVLRIGDGCVIGRGSHIVAHCSIDIGDDVYTGPYVYITDQNHSYADPEVPIGRQWPVNSAVRIGAGTWLGTGVVVLPGSVIGRNVVVAAGSVVRGVVADYCVVAGVPARVIKEFSPGSGWTAPGADGGRIDPDLAVPDLISPDLAGPDLIRPDPAVPDLAESGLAAAEPPMTPLATGPATLAPPVSAPLLTDGHP